MLELPALRIEPWRTDIQSEVPAVWQRRLLDPITQQPVGYAGWQPKTKLRYLSPAWFALYEADETPLVSLTHKVWKLTPRWEVYDADRLTVGSIHRQYLYHASLGLLHREQPVKELVLFRSKQGHDLAELAEEADSRRLRFLGPTLGEPFLKMLILSAALLS